MKKNTQNEVNQVQSTPIDVFLGRAAMVGFMLAFCAYLTADVVAAGLA